MINLLPPIEKENMRREENWRIVLVLGITVLAAFICFSLVLFSVKIIISGSVEAEKILFGQKEKELEDSQADANEKELNAINQGLVSLNSLYQNQVSFTDILEEITKTIPSGVLLNNLSLSPHSSKEINISCTLSGFAPDRESLLEFKANLEEESSFNDIYFPPASWTEQTNINFTVNFLIK